jgi:fructosamine-3-kinase
LDSAYEQIGEAVGQLHQLAFPVFGEIDAKGQVSPPEHAYLPALRKHAENIIQSPRLQEVFLTVLDQHATWFDGVGESRLCHEDLHGHNILFARKAGEWRLAAILDFEKVWAGHVETDLARLELWRGMTSPAFWLAYQLFQPFVDGYVNRRSIYQLLWCLEYARHTPEHLADTRKICLELGVPVIERFD